MGSIEDPAEFAYRREVSITQLIKIDGISRKTAEAIYEMGIRNYTDLAEYLHHHNAEEFSGALKKYGLNRPPGLINMQKLIHQAEAFSQAEKNTHISSAEGSQPTKTPEEAAPSREFRDHDAVFTVSFDIFEDEDGKPVLVTTVYDEKNAGKETTFRGSDTSLWVNWMLERANLPVIIEQPEAEIEVTEELPEAEAAALPVPEEPYKAQITISKVQLTTIELLPEAPEKRLRTEISFQLSGTDAEALASNAFPFRISINTIELGRGTPALLVSRDGQLEPNKFEYTFQLESEEPAAGRYESHSVVRLPPAGDLMGYHRGPSITISSSPNQ